jgi:hypothetical protein
VRGFLPSLKELALKYEGRIQFLFLYILEAHATDEWPISSGRYVPSGEAIAVKQHKTIEERISACQSFVE